MEHSKENISWAVGKVKVLAAAFGKKIETPELASALARQFLNIVIDNEPVDKEGLGTGIRRGDWLIDTLIESYSRWPSPFQWRKTWGKYWPSADGKDWWDMPGASE